jgi:hypothetical protein
MAPKNNHVVLQNGNKRKIFEHSALSDFLKSLTSPTSENKFFEVKVDDFELKEPFALDTLRLLIISVERLDDSGKSFKFTANGFYNNPDLEGKDNWKPFGISSGIIKF